MAENSLCMIEMKLKFIKITKLKRESIKKMKTPNIKCIGNNVIYSSPEEHFYS